MFIPSPKLVYEISHCNTFPTANITKDHQLLGIGGAILVDELGICKQKFASLISSKILQIHMVFTLLTHLSTT